MTQEELILFAICDNLQLIVVKVIAILHADVLPTFLHPLLTLYYKLTFIHVNTLKLELYF